MVRTRICASFPKKILAPSVSQGQSYGQEQDPCRGSVRVRSMGQCQFSNFRFNSGGNVLGGEGYCPGGEKVRGEYVRGGNVYTLLANHFLSAACRACDYVYIDYVRRSRSGQCRLLRPINCQTYITLHYTQTWRIYRKLLNQLPPVLNVSRRQQLQPFPRCHGNEHRDIATNTDDRQQNIIG